MLETCERPCTSSYTSLYTFFQDIDSSKSFLDQASVMYERATSGILSKSMLLHFAQADFEEQQMRMEKAKAIYQKYLEIEEVDPTLVSENSKELENQRNQRENDHLLKCDLSKCFKDAKKRHTLKEIEVNFSGKNGHSLK